MVCRSIVFIGLSTFISLYARAAHRRRHAAGTAALFVLYLGGAVGTVLGGRLANRWDRVAVARWSYLVTGRRRRGDRVRARPGDLRCSWR